MKKLFTILFALSVNFTFMASAQDNPNLGFSGWVKNGAKAISEAEISICQRNAASLDCAEVEHLTTKKNGAFEFKLKPNESYEVHVTKDGFSDHVIEINTSIGDADVSKNPAWQFEVDMSTHADAESPIKIVSVFFDAKNNRFDYVRLDSK